VALAGFVTGTLHLSPLQISALNAAARADYDAGTALLRSTTTYDAAIGAFERSVSVDPDSALPYAGLAEAEWAKQSLAPITNDTEWLLRASRHLAEAQRRNPDLARVWMVAATLDVTNSFFERGVSEYLRAIELDPNYSDAYRNLGRIYEITGQKEQALTAYRRAVALDPQYYRTPLYLGGYFLRQYQFTEALEPLRRAVVLAPDEYEPRYYLADAYQLLGRYPEAETELRVALDIRETPRLLTTFGETLMYERREGEAVAPLTRAVNLAPSEYYSWRLLGICYRRLGQTQEAARAYEAGLKAADEAKSMNPRYGRHRANAAFFRAVLGERALAESEIAQAMTLSVDGTEVRAAAVATYEALGEREATLRVLGDSPPDLLSDLSRWPDYAGLQADPRFVQMLVSNMFHKYRKSSEGETWRP
jgi:tetratricopeptide (TPR) repeat protein